MKELLTNLTKQVLEKEDYTLRYIMSEQIEAEGTPDIVMLET